MFNDERRAERMAEELQLKSVKVLLEKNEAKNASRAKFIKANQQANDQNIKRGCLKIIEHPRFLLNKFQYCYSGKFI